MREQMKTMNVDELRAHNKGLLKPEFINFRDHIALEFAKAILSSTEQSAGWLGWLLDPHGRFEGFSRIFWLADRFLEESILTKSTVNEDVDRPNVEMIDAKE